jgi:hypothetical protein
MSALDIAPLTNVPLSFNRDAPGGVGQPGALAIGGKKVGQRGFDPGVGPNVRGGLAGGPCRAGHQGMGCGARQAEPGQPGQTGLVNLVASLSEGSFAYGAREGVAQQCKMSASGKC